MKTIVLLAALVFSGSMARSQSYADDVKSLDKIISALYGVISGEAGAPRNWERFKYLFAPDARLMPTSKNAEGLITHRSISPDEYVNLFTTRITTGFYEQEIHRVTEEYGSIVHLFSSYATQQTAGGPNTNRGINSIQLLKTNERYYIISIFWCAESMGFPLPDKYL